MNKYQESDDTPELDWGWGGQLVVNGGLFRGNHSGQGNSAPDGTARPGALYGGGAIFISTPNSGNSAVNGGVFDGNYVPQVTDGHSNRGGGAIHSRRGTLTIAGGIFRNNRAEGMSGATATFGAGGGAVYVACVNNNEMGLANALVSSKLTVTNSDAYPNGPTFDKNESTGQGGAIMVSWNASGSFEYGTFTNNFSEQMGGAIYTEESTISEFGYSAVYGNTAAHFGGGLWLCPSGVSISSQRSNLALFDNAAGGSDAALALDKYLAAHGTGAAGDDLAIMYPNKDVAKSNSVNIASGWYAGKDAVTWYQDGQSTVKATGFGEMGTNWGIGHLGNPDAFSVVSSVPRYAAGQTAFPTGAYTLTQSKEDIPVWNQKGGIALKAIANSEDAKQAAKDQAHLIFTGNTAGMSGGAIGSDGSLRFTSSGLASWSKVDANDDSRALPGSSWTLTYEGTAATPYADADEEIDLWAGATDISAKWSKGSGGTWVATVEDNTGQADYVGYDTDSRPGYFSIENLAEGTYSFTEASAPEGYAKGDATYTFAIDLSTAASAAKMPQVYVRNGNAVSGNAIGNTPLPSIPDIVLTAHKTLAGGTLSKGQFAFDLDEQGGTAGTYTYTKVQQGVTNDADGNVTFDKLTYTSPGEHVYRIREQVPADATENLDGSHSKDGVVYDQTAYYVKVSVTWGWKDANGNPVPEGTTGAKANLVANVTYYSDEACTQAIDGAAYPDYVPAFTNEVTTDWQFTKTDGETNAALPGATFRLFRLADGAQDTDAPLDAANPGKDWVLAGESVSSDGSGGTAAGLVSFSNLTSGTYRLVESKAADGYTRPAGQWRVVVDTGAAGDASAPKVRVTGTVGATPPAFKDNGDGTWSLPNHKGMTLPVSGGTGAWLSAGIGAALMVSAITAAVLRRKGYR